MGKGVLKPMDAINNYGNYVANYMDAMKKPGNTAQEGERKVKRQADKGHTGNHQVKDSVAISEEGRSALQEKLSVKENITKIGEIKELPSLNAGRLGVMNEFEKIMAEPAQEKGTGKDTFDSYVDKMAAAYQLMKARIDEKYAAPDKQKEYYAAGDGSMQELTKDKELEMLNQAYELHSQFMAASTQIWSELQDFKAHITYHSGGNTDRTQIQAQTKDSTITKEGTVQGAAVKERAYQAFMSAIGKGNGDKKDSVLNAIWDYYAARKR